MDGFNVISVASNTSAPGQTAPVESAIEIIDEEKARAKAEPTSLDVWLFWLSILFLISTLGYTAFMFVSRVSTVNQIIAYSEQIAGIGKNIDIKEIQDFQAMDNTLKIINTRLASHVMSSDVLYFVNQNIRKTLQITEYRFDTRPNEVEINLSAIAPSFRELAEQTEKFYVQKESGNIKSFAVTNLSFEAETKRVKFTLRIIFDRSKVNAVALTNSYDSQVASPN
jgi:hypothetical protein